MNDHLTRDGIMRLASRATIGGEQIAVFTIPELEKFVALVAEKERDACAKVAESIRPLGGRMFDEAQNACFSALTDCATAIRSRIKNGIFVE